MENAASARVNLVAVCGNFIRANGETVHEVQKVRDSLILRLRVGNSWTR